ncbi:hypothetical protein F511_16404 [Dorcoceras hygrometricum]|uniref:Uncharacterized protein n=1 Tax=Dorcoceras hygrometricum TaxID=472368 RepID=A0A2Z7CM57_9LAMI|nr:hypothetical protein F511_16404 [Dorcoceras hygrometricum]
MKMEFCLLHNIVAKALCAKAGSFDMVTSEKFDLMVEISAGLKVVGDDSNTDKQEAHVGCETQTDHEGHDENESTVAQGEQAKSTADGTAGPEGENTEMEEWVDKVERIELDKSSNQIEKENATHDKDIVVRYGPEQPSPHTITYTGKGIFAPVEIWVINWATYILTKVDPAAKGKWMLEAVARPNPLEEHCQLFLNTVWEDVSSTMTDYDEWVHSHCEQVSELFKRRSLILYKLYELKVQKLVDEHMENFNPAAPSVNYDFMCIQFLSRELKEISRKHRDLRVLAGLPIVAPKSSFAGDGANIAISQITLSEEHKVLST